MTTKTVSSNDVSSSNRDEVIVIDETSSSGGGESQDKADNNQEEERSENGVRVTEDVGGGTQPKKTCCKCFISKDVSQFWKDSMKPDGLCRSCIACKNEYKKRANTKLQKQREDRLLKEKARKKLHRMEANDTMNNNNGSNDVVNEGVDSDEGEEKNERDEDDIIENATSPTNIKSSSFVLGGYFVHEKVDVNLAAVQTRLEMRLLFASTFLRLASIVNGKQLAHVDSKPIMPKQDDFTVRVGGCNLHIFDVFEQICIIGGGSAKVTIAKEWTEMAAFLGVTRNDMLAVAGWQLKQRFIETFPPYLEKELMRLFPKRQLQSFARQCEYGAARADLPPSDLSQLEMDAFFASPGNLVAPVTMRRYVDCRNHILQVWHVAYGCGFLDFYQHVLKPLLLVADGNHAWLQHEPLEIVFFTLQVLGHLNFGVARNLLPPLPPLDLDQQQQQQQHPQKPHTQTLKDNANPFPLAPPANAHDVSHSNGGDTSAGVSPRVKHFGIVGAGLSGLACAIQLRRLGHEVTILEGRNRAGGRVHTDSSFFSKPVDLGAMLITGVRGHPCSVVADQLKQDQFCLKDDELCPLYLNHCLVSQEMDKQVEELFNEMLNTSSETRRFFPKSSRAVCVNTLDVHLRQIEQSKRVEKMGGLKKTPGSVGVEEVGENKFAAFVFDCSGKKCQVGGDGHVFNTVKEAMVAHDEEVIRRVFVESMDEWHHELNFELDESVKTAHANRVNYFFKMKTLNQSIAGWKIFRNNNEESWKETLPARFPNLFGGKSYSDYGLLNAMFLKPTANSHLEKENLQSALLGWHVANLEYGCATNLKNLSTLHWDQDDDFIWEGDHCLLPGGFGVLPDRLASFAQEIGCHLRYKEKVVKIHLLEEKEGVSIRSLSDDNLATVRRFDAVVVTASLGVLKAGTIAFDPPLPKWKLDAIDRLGFGNLNKVVLEFETSFWEKQELFFGRVNPEINMRGAYYMFWCLDKQDEEDAKTNSALTPRPILLALIAGDAANAIECESDDTVVISNCLDALRECFPKDFELPHPVKAIVTRWGQDEFARGSYSYIKANSLGAEDYLLMAEPIKDRLFFAGEATSRDHPATTGGAFLSGLREATKIASKFGVMSSFFTGGEDSRELLQQRVKEKKIDKEMSDVLARLSKSCNLFFKFKEKKPNQNLAKVVNETRMGLNGLCDTVLSEIDLFLCRTQFGATTQGEGHLLQTKNWFHLVEQDRFVTLEKLLKQDEKSPDSDAMLSLVYHRLPKSWEGKRKVSYLLTRFGEEVVDEYISSKNITN